MLDDRTAEGRGFPDLDVIPDRLGRDARAEAITQAGKQLAIEGAFGVKEVREDADLHGPPDPRGHRPHGGPLSLGSSSGEEAGLHRDHHLVGRPEGVEGQESDGRRAVDDAVVQGVGEDIESPPQAAITVPRFHETATGGLGPSQAHRAGEQPEAVDDLPGPGGDLRWRHPLDRRIEQKVDGAVLDLLLGDPEGGGTVGLGVEVDQHDPATRGGEHRGEIDRGGGLSATALLVHDRDDPHVVACRLRGGCREEET